MAMVQMHPNVNRPETRMISRDGIQQLQPPFFATDLVSREGVALTDY